MKNKIKKNRILLGVVFTLLIILISSTSFISAEIGCCFNPTNGLCSLNSEQDSCDGGQFFSNPSCTDSQCQKGCCLVAGNGEMLTSRACQLKSQANGVEYNFQNIDTQACTALTNSQVKGACVLGEYGDQCVYTTQAQCGSGNFHAGIYCCDSSLNNSCDVTTTTVCQDNKAYYKDTCGNICQVKESCDYNSGFTCEKTATQPAHCKSINCASAGKNNGDSWCSGDGESTSVGSRFFKQYCLNGNVETEPCADFRQETCSSGEEGGEASCHVNPWQDCLAAGNDSESCDENFCKMWPTGLDCNVLQAPQGGIAGANCMDEAPTAAIGSCSSGACVQSTAKSILFDDLELGTCLPLVQGGLKTYTSAQGSGQSSTNSESSANSVCAAGDYSATIYFDADTGSSPQWALAKETDDEADTSYVDFNNNKYGYAGILDMAGFETDNSQSVLTGDWLGDTQEHDRLIPAQENNPVYDAVYTTSSKDAPGFAKKLNKLAENGSLPDPELLRVLEERCRLISDCDGKENWVGGVGSGLTSAAFHCTKADRYDHVKCEFNFKCKSWKAPTSGECSQCGKDDLPCSEYRCKAISGSCDYYEPEGADQGHCVSSSDTSAPVITLKSITPNPPIPPYTAAEFVINTDKDSECKFNLDSAGVKYDDMQYEFGNDFSKEHTIILNIPGQTNSSLADIGENTLAYNLMNQGSHTLYVRCLDAAGHGQASSPFPINFQVMQNPDNLAPVIINATPISGSAIKYNTTSKDVIFKINEPAECKWSSVDKDFSSMENGLSCETSVSDAAIIRGYYSCSGKLNNITTSLSDQTKFYVRCKDQPWLEGNETDLYHRNTNDNSFQYLLRASQELVITETSPIGEITKKVTNTSVTLSLITSGGGSNGKAICKWRLSNSSELNSSFVNFYHTNANTHSQIISDKPAGTYYVEVKCQDSSENNVSASYSYNLLIDMQAPLIAKIYEYMGNLRIKTNEEAKCFVSNNKYLGCSFSKDNATRMDGSEKEHKTPWNFDKTYYVRCEDYYGNTNEGNCNIITKTY